MPSHCRVSPIVYLMALAACGLVVLGCRHAPSLGNPGMDPFGLTQLRNARALRSSSSARDWAASNADSRPIAPGQTLVLAELEGPGVVRHIWNTVNSKEFGASRLLTLRIYWDGEVEPSVACPLGDFFGVGHGLDVNVNSTMVRVSAGGKARNCYWPMPFRKSARITLTNDGRLPTEAFYYYIDWAKVDALSADTPYFHAMYQQAHPCQPNGRYVVADLRGRGHYVGTVLNCRQHQRGWMGEGDDFFFIDGESEPSLRGTGTEDYFCDAWGFREDDGPYYGVPVYEGVEIQDRTSVYRWHVADPIPFRESLRFELEHWGWWWVDDGAGGEKIAAGERYDDWSTVAFWYQLEPHAPFPPLPDGPARQYYDWSNVQEAEGVRDRMAATAGTLGAWGGGSGGLFVHWEVPAAGARLSVPFEVASAGEYTLVLALQQRPHFGVLRFAIDGESTGRQLDLYHARGAARLYALPPRHFEAGSHILMLESLGKHHHSTGFSAGLDALLLVPAEVSIGPHQSAGSKNKRPPAASSDSCTPGMAGLSSRRGTS